MWFHFKINLQSSVRLKLHKSYYNNVTAISFHENCIFDSLARWICRIGFFENSDTSVRRKSTAKYFEFDLYFVFRISSTIQSLSGTFKQSGNWMDSALIAMSHNRPDNKCENAHDINPENKNHARIQSFFYDLNCLGLRLWRRKKTMQVASKPTVKSNRTN